MHYVTHGKMNMLFLSFKLFFFLWVGGAELNAACSLQHCRLFLPEGRSAGSFCFFLGLLQICCYFWGGVWVRPCFSSCHWECLPSSMCVFLCTWVGAIFIWFVSRIDLWPCRGGHTAAGEWGWSIVAALRDLGDTVCENVSSFFHFPLLFQPLEHITPPQRDTLWGRVSLFHSGEAGSLVSPW